MILRPFESGRRIFGGVDLSSKVDLTAFAMVQKVEPGWICNWMFWIPEDTAEKRARDDGLPYLQWQEQGYLKFTPGPRINMDFVKQDIVEACYEHGITQIGLDPWNAEWLIHQLEGAGLWPFEVRQGYSSLSEPSKWFEASISEGSFKHGRNPIATAHVENVEIQSDVNGNIRPVKSGEATKRIDAVVAAIIAMAGAIVCDSETVASVYDMPGNL